MSRSGCVSELVLARELSKVVPRHGTHGFSFTPRKLLLQYDLVNVIYKTYTTSTLLLLLLPTNYRPVP